VNRHNERTAKLQDPAAREVREQVVNVDNLRIELPDVGQRRATATGSDPKSSPRDVSGLLLQMVSSGGEQFDLVTGSKQSGAL
jgi:hypothetical protein